MKWHTVLRVLEPLIRKPKACYECVYAHYRGGMYECVLYEDEYDRGRRFLMESPGRPPWCPLN